MTLDINTLKKGLVESRVWKSVVRHGYPDTETNRALAIMSNLFLHLHPVKVKRHALKFNYTFGLGGLSLLLFIVEAVTGAFLMFYYVPSVERAFFDMKDLRFAVYFGVLMRNMHRWAAHGMVAVVFLHMCRVFYTAAYKTPREFNWVLGVFLFVVTLAFSYTGYLLPWDQLAYWAVTICTSMLGYIPICGPWLLELFRGGSEVGGPTLANFFVLHVAFIPGSLFVLMLWHFWLVRRAGGLVQVKKDEQVPVDRVPTVPDLVVREAAFGLLLIAFVLILAIVWDAPLLEQANPGMSPNPAKAPWYFLGFQELLLHLHPVFATLVWPLMGALAFLCVPFWADSSLPTGVWFGSARGRTLAVWTSAVGAGATLALVLTDNLLLQSAAPVSNTLMTRGLLPTGLLIALLAGLYFLLVRKLKYTRAETVMAGIILTLVVLTVCTIIGVWFRGPEMHLSWP